MIYECMSYFLWSDCHIFWDKEYLIITTKEEG